MAARLDIDIVRRAGSWDGTGVTDAMLRRAAGAAFAAAAPAAETRFEITILLTDDGEMRELNRTWRGKDFPTNVLSFPAAEPIGAATARPTPLGDIVLAAETVLAEAAEQGITPAAHAAHLVVHGMLHLLGFDHERDEDAEAMEALETNVLDGLGIADPYAEPHDAPLARSAR
jgi:probable rRNA maturation factor